MQAPWRIDGSWGSYNTVNLTHWWTEDLVGPKHTPGTLAREAGLGWTLEWRVKGTISHPLIAGGLIGNLLRSTLTAPTEHLLSRRKLCKLTRRGWHRSSILSSILAWCELRGNSWRAAWYYDSNSCRETCAVVSCLAIVEWFHCQYHEPCDFHG